jgi:DNA-binding response OmpR family regulator
MPGFRRTIIPCSIGEFPLASLRTLPVDSPTQPHLILLVDDAPEIARMLTIMLTRAGYLVSHVPNAEAAYAALETTTPSLVLADVELPGESGFAVCRALKNSPATQHIPVVIMSGAEARNVAQQAAEAGADMCLTKPFGLETLLACVRALLKVPT